MSYIFQFDWLFAENIATEPPGNDGWIVSGGEHERDAELLEAFRHGKYHRVGQENIEDGGIDLLIFDEGERMIDAWCRTDDDCAELGKLFTRILCEQKLIFYNENSLSGKKGTVGKAGFQRLTPPVAN
ncbi:hypothetical protein FHX15_000811 [Rhizobium sp. BK650]|uniref:hypothetical protein n=1 Tax=Rhizobium sp. BK650 TaxID=2586990 RepID=UPI00161F3379|nr:hypothetical protein [Rhizobium sp. BK650]MBB3655612.1 hypothetical protein [Rhizobium sp. BK650]